MTAARLREAARKIRDTAEGTMGEGDWYRLPFTVGLAKAAAHIALWSPPVALAVADWLDEAAEDLDAVCYTRPLLPKAHTLADLILGNQP